MKRRRYEARYKGHVYYVHAFCEEGAWYAVLEKTGVKLTIENIDRLAESEKMEIFPV